VGEFFNEYLLDPLAFWTDVRGDFWLGYVIAALVQCVILLNVVAVGALFFIWLERKVSGRIQDRLGPTRVGGRFGWLQTLADGLKLLTKEDLTPDGADPMLFRMAPYVSFAAGFAAYLALPFSNTWVAWELNIALFFILAVLGIEVFGVILAGYASGSKWSLFGAMREAAQVVSYEVPLGLCAVIPVVICGTMNLMTIGNMQAGLFTNWLVLHDPFTFAVFFVYFTCATASVNRAPFDLAEAESELVAGFPYRILRPAVELFLYGRVRLDVRRGGLGGDLVLRRLERADPHLPLAGLGAARREPDRVRHGRMVQVPDRQPVRRLELHSQGGDRRDRDDVGSLDAAAAADRPGDDHLPQVLHPAGGRLLPGRGALANVRSALAQRSLRRRLAAALPASQ
jgi:NADH:ubiquinone oxidoreductase subunit H